MEREQGQRNISARRRLNLAIATLKAGGCAPGEDSWTPKRGKGADLSPFDRFTCQKQTEDGEKCEFVANDDNTFTCQRQGGIASPETDEAKSSIKEGSVSSKRSEQEQNVEDATAVQTSDAASVQQEIEQSGVDVESKAKIIEDQEKEIEEIRSAMKQLQEATEDSKKRALQQAEDAAKKAQEEQAAAAAKAEQAARDAAEAKAAAEAARGGRARGRAEGRGGGRAAAAGRGGASGQDGRRGQVGDDDGVASGHRRPVDGRQD